MIILWIAQHLGVLPGHPNRPKKRRCITLNLPPILNANLRENLGPILQCLGQMCRLDSLTSGQVCNSPRQLQYAVIPSR